MLDMKKLLDSNTVRGLIAVTIPILVLLASFFGVDEAVFSAKLSAIGEKLVALVGLVGVAWAFYARAFTPTPPLTQAAAAKTQALLDQTASVQSAPETKQGGYIRPALLALILLFSVALPATLGLSGCASLGLPVAQGWNERLAAGYTTVTAVREATEQWLDARVQAAQQAPAEKREALVQAARQDAINIQNQADVARQGLEVAQSLRGINVAASEERLASTLRILQALQQYLESRHEG